MHPTSVHLVQVLVRAPGPDGATFLLYPHESWRRAPGAEPFLVLPTRKTVADPLAPFLRGQSLETFVGEIMEDQLGLGSEDWLLEQELTPVAATFPAVHSAQPKAFTLCPVEVWTAPAVRTPLGARVQGLWLTPNEALRREDLSPSARAVLAQLLLREAELDRRYLDRPEEEAREESPHRLLRRVPDRPSMYALACRWFTRNRAGVRLLPKETLDQVLAAGNRAFNLRVADPYLRYQLQGVGCTWSFFTHKDRQDVHVHSAPSVEIYGVLEGRLEIWWKPYHDRGTSAWSHRVAGPGDWVEMDALQCHFVRWLGPGKGVVFKAGPGPLAEVGRLGVKGKTTCDACPCIKPPEMLAPPDLPTPTETSPPAHAAGAGAGAGAGVAEAPPDVSSTKPWGLSVRALLRDTEGRVLLLRRSAASRNFAGQWELPGGKPDPGESPDEALRREVREETGLEATVDGLLGSAEFEVPAARVANLFFSAHHTPGPVRLSSEHDACRWVEPRDLAAVDLAPAVGGFLLSWQPRP